MTYSTLNSVLEDLGKTQIKKQVPALEQAVDIVDSIAIQAVDAFRKSPNRFLVAERLKCLGSVIVPHLEKLFKESDDSETQILAALVLLQFNSRVGIPCLLDAVTQDENYAGLVAEHLAKLGIKAAIEPILNRLRNCHLEKVDLVVNLLDALAKLGGVLPYDLQQRLSAADVPWQIRTIYQNNFADLSNPDSPDLNGYPKEQLKPRFKKWSYTSDKMRSVNLSTVQLPPVA